MPPTYQIAAHWEKSRVIIFSPPVLVYCGCSPHLSGLIILYPYIYGLSILLAKYIHINMDKIERPKLYTLPDTLPAAGTICPTCPTSGRRSTLVFVCPGSGTVCPVACDVQPFRVCWGLGSPPAGCIGSAGGGAGDARSFRSE